MAKLKAIYWDDRTLFSKEKLDEYIIILADLIKKWDPVKFDGTSFKLMSYFEEMQKVLSMLKDEFEEERNLEEIVDLKNISSYHPLTKELENSLSLQQTGGELLL